MRTELKKSKRIVVKVGSSIVNSIEKDYISTICNDISEFIQEEKEIVLVTSGAISQGMKILNIKEKPKDIKKLQALAAVGQQKLMLIYEQNFSKNNKHAAQVLITHSDINDRVRYLNIKGTIEELFTNKIIPIINENDVVSTEEIKLGDNDNLASMISNLINADLMIILTDQKGMYDKNPDNYDDAKLINTINIDEIKTYDTDFSTQSITGTGGFVTKIQAVKRAALSNTYTLIASGYEENVLRKVFEDNKMGTLFVPLEKKISAKKQWLDTTDNHGAIIIDNGACKALQQNKSLLFVGVTDVKNSFQKGDVVRCVNLNNICIAKGITNYDSDDVILMKGKSTEDIKNLHGDEFTRELIHTDSLIVIEI